jgi:hypothetical protein
MDRDIDMDTNNNMAINMDAGIYMGMDIDKNIAINTDMNMDTVYENYLNRHYTKILEYS